LDNWQSFEPALVSLAAALGLGFLIGIERERRKGTGPQRAFAGVRTFTLVALSGCLLHLVREPWLTAVGGAVVGALAVAGYLRDRAPDPGITTELSLFVTYVLGVTAADRPALAAGTGVLVAGLLAARHGLHNLSRNLIRPQEMRDALLLAGAILVVLPLLPDHAPAFAPSVNPRRIWELVVVVLLIQAGGQLALRLLGERAGLMVSGFLSGFVSATATMAALGSRCRDDPALRPHCVAAALFANAATFLQLFALAWVVDASLLPKLLPPLAAGLVTIALIAAWMMRGVSKQAIAVEDAPKSAFSFSHALIFAALMTGVTTWVGWMKTGFGDWQVMGSVGIAGFADAHAAAIAAFHLHLATPPMPDNEVVLLVLIGLSTNTISKTVAAWTTGGRSFALSLLPGLVLMLVAAWAGLLLLR
jgi:uncharacterized membrane protein (DUF4010 family)